MSLTHTVRVVAHACSRHYYLYANAVMLSYPPTINNEYYTWIYSHELTEPTLIAVLSITFL